MVALVVLTTLVSTSRAFSVTPKKTATANSNNHEMTAAVDRRTAVANFLGTAAVGAGVLLLSSPTPALASGGATAGKYT